MKKTLEFAEFIGALRISVEVTPEFESYLSDAYPRALQRLKAICEGAS